MDLDVLERERRARMLQQNAQTQGGVPPVIRPTSVRDAIQNAPEPEFKEPILKNPEVREEIESKYRPQTDMQNAAQPADGLRRMIDRTQTSAMQLPTGPSRQARAAAYDWSFYDPDSDSEERIEGRYVAPGAGVIHTDAAGETWMGTDTGSYENISRRTQEEIEELKKRMTDTTLPPTGRYYKPGADGKSPQWLKAGDQVVTAGGTFAITGHDPNGHYISKLVDPSLTTDTYKGPYNEGTYGAITGVRNANPDDFLGNRENGEFAGYGGYSFLDGKKIFNTVARTFDGKNIHSAVIDGVPYKLGVNGDLSPLEAGSVVQDATGRYWMIGGDGVPEDVTPAVARNNPLNDPMIALKQSRIARDAGVVREPEPVELDPVTKAQIAQMELQTELAKQQAGIANRDLYRQYRIGQEGLSDEIIAAGLQDTGANDLAHANLTAQFIEGQNANEGSAEASAADIARKIEMLKLQGEMAERERIKNDLQRKADTLAGYGDFSGYGAVGYTPQQVGNMEAAYAKANQDTFGGLSPYAQTLVSLKQSNPEYDARGALEKALRQGLITAQDLQAALIMIGG